MAPVPRRRLHELQGPDRGFVELELRGLTVVQVAGDSEGWQYSRFVDFLGALHQMGVTTTTRPMLTSERYEAWNDAIRGG